MCYGIINFHEDRSKWDLGGVSSSKKGQLNPSKSQYESHGRRVAGVRAT